MKRIALTLVLAHAATGVLAQSGPTTQAMTCSQARGLVAAQCAVVLHTSPTTYDRYVRDGSFCPHPLAVQTAYVRTADAAQCPVGGVCRDTPIETGD